MEWPILNPKTRVLLLRIKFNQLSKCLPFYKTIPAYIEISHIFKGSLWIWKNATNYHVYMQSIQKLIRFIFLFLYFTVLFFCSFYL